MEVVEYIVRADQPRVLVVSQRRVRAIIPRCLDFEFEDLIASIDDADIIAPLTQKLVDTPVRRIARGLERKNPACLGRLFAGGRLRLERQYGLVFFVCMGMQDLIGLWPLRPWLRAARCSACYIDEVWAHDVGRRSGEISLLQQFDFLFVGCHGSVDAIAAATGKPTAYLPPSTNTLMFSPFPVQPERVIDVYAMGRRPRQTHEALLRLAAERGWFYMYDTSAAAPVLSPVEHRRRLAHMINRTRYFLVNAARGDSHEETGGQQEAGFRFFEGAAGGAVLIGDPPKTCIFQELFGWDDAVACFPKDSPDVGEVIDELESDPDRVARICSRNVRNSLLQHDGVYRWAQVLETVGMRPLGALDRRRQAVSERARAFAEPAGRGAGPRTDPVRTEAVVRADPPRI